MSAPAVSVAMPVRDAMPYLNGSLDSILGQTFEDFEFVILDNGSTDGSAELLRDAAKSDDRIRVLERRDRLSLGSALNLVVSEARAPLVARMDGDDICAPTRLQRQVDVMAREPDTVVVGTLAEGIDHRGRSVRPRDRWRLIRCEGVPFPHGSAMFRRAAFDEVGGYCSEAFLWEDADLFLKLSGVGRLLVLPEALYRYRFHQASTTLSPSHEQATRAAEDLERAFARPDAGRRGVAAVLRSQGALRLWAGQRPATLHELFRTGALSFDRSAIQALMWSAWAYFSPATLRSALRGLIRVRDRAAGVRLGTAPCEWRVGE